MFNRSPGNLKDLFLIVFFLLSINSIYGQSYSKMIDTTAVWVTSYKYLTSPGDPLQGGMEKYYFNGDTIISGELYNKIFDSTQNYLGYGISSLTYSEIFNYYVGCIREDTLAKRVYFINSLSDEEYLLYDFDLGVGDTLPFTYLNSWDVHTVFSVDSILVGSHYRKRMQLYDNGMLSLIEGIGSNRGLFGRMDLPPLVDQSINCFTDNNVTTFFGDNPYMPDSINICNFMPATLVSIESNTKASDIIIYPNPATNELQAEFQNISPHKLRIEIISFNGYKLVDCYAVNTNHHISIGVEDLPQGCYFIKFSVDSGLQYCKTFIKY